MKTGNMISIALIIFFIVGAAGIAFDSPSRTILINSVGSSSMWGKYQGSNDTIIANKTAYISAGLIVCDTGVETILTRNKTLAESYGCTW